MANVEGNRIALRDVLGEMFPTAPRARVSAEIDGDAFYTRAYAASGSPSWDRVDVYGYAIAILAGDDEQATFTAPGFLRFGSAGSGAQGDEGALPVLPGAVFKLPQGCPGFWFKPGADTKWRVVVVRRPHVDAQYGGIQPGHSVTIRGGFGEAGFGMQVEPGTDPIKVVFADSTAPIVTSGLHNLVETDDPQTGSPTGVGIGNATRRLVLQFCDDASPAAYIVGAEVGDYEVWFKIDGLWCHNPADDVRASSPRGAASATNSTHTYETWQLASHVYVRKLTGNSFYYKSHAISGGVY